MSHHEAIPEGTDKFRDTISLIDDSGERNWVYAKKPKGKLHTARSFFGYSLIFFLFLGPFIKINGHPFILLDILSRKFILFGFPFWPQDLPLLGLILITGVVAVILFTVMFGRLWCGWSCPQTVFMELFFRKIEFMIEGDFNEQKKLDASPWTTEKIFKKTLKHIIFYTLSVFIANIFLAYIIGADELLKLITDGPIVHWGQLLSLIIFSTVFYFVFAKFREIICIVVCPYGRLQGLMLDNNSLVVAYDFVRGEPRGAIRKNETTQHGDCIDCKRCVQVCPTGIDIRNGTQLECVNCTACIDECNDVMTKIKRPNGLVRFASQEQIVNGTQHAVSFRSVAYVAILFVLIGASVYFVSTRKDISTAILRTPGMLYQEQDSLHVSNMYNFDVINKTFTEQQIDIKIVEPITAELKMVDRKLSHIQLGEDSLAKGSFFIILPRDKIISNNSEIKFQIWSNGVLIDELKTNFIGPVKLNSTK
ncbi:MAG: cytochrome c oxidase accessory protein CcoG [Bacteroidota bacterium]